MTGTRAPDGQSPPCAIDISHLRSEQRQLLSSLLRAGEVPFGIVRNELIAAESFANEVQDALDWVTAPLPVDGSEFDDPEYRGDLPPLVRPTRQPLPDGRLPATRCRRFNGGIIDQVLVGVPTGLAAHAAAATWMVVVVHMFYFVVPTAMFGWSIGKLVTRTRVVDVKNHRQPNWFRAIVRWVLPYAAVIFGLTVGLHGDAMGLIIALVYLPIMLDLRGWHDRAAHTLVVESKRPTPRRAT